MDVQNSPEDGIEPDIHADLLDLRPEDVPDADIVWASPPCTSSSWANNGAPIQHYDNERRLPLTEDAVIHRRLVTRTLYFIGNLEPDYWFLENPSGRYADWDMLPMIPNRIDYCAYGHHTKKPTYLWGRHPDSFEYRTCSGDHRHEKQQQVTSGGDTAVRSMVPKGLSEAIVEAIENPGPRQQGLDEIY